MIKKLYGGALVHISESLGRRWAYAEPQEFVDETFGVVQRTAYAPFRYVRVWRDWFCALCKGRTSSNCSRSNINDVCERCQRRFSIWLADTIKRVEHRNILPVRYGRNDVEINGHRQYYYNKSYTIGNKQRSLCFLVPEQQLTLIPREGVMAC